MAVNPFILSFLNRYFVSVFSTYLLEKYILQYKQKLSLLTIKKQQILRPWEIRDVSLSYLLLYPTKEVRRVDGASVILYVSLLLVQYMYTSRLRDRQTEDRQTASAFW